MRRLLAVIVCLAQFACSGDDEGGLGADAAVPGVDSGSDECTFDTDFCNGVERMIDGHCVRIAANPCDDGFDCTTDSCDEASDTCTHTPTGACATCMADQCTPDCAGKMCGDDGCGSTCGDCGANMGCASATGQCQSAAQLGTCGMPIPITVTLGAAGTQTIIGDTTTALHQVTPTCNTTSTAVELVYSFTITQPTGIDARSYGYDTVLHIRKENPGTVGTECLDDLSISTVGCSDDAAPPGDYGSRVAVLLTPGDYFLIVDGFDSTQFGPFSLQVTFLDNCVPQCDGKFCGGDDGCGGNCGSCDAGFACGVDLRCRPDPCVPDCTNDDASARVCGDDGCLGSCGTCSSDTLCVDATGSCETFPSCDHDAPVCAPACAFGQFCGTDCACHDENAAMPDLIVNSQRLVEEILFDDITVDANSCSVAEACVGGTGTRRVMRFSVEAVNQGQATLTVPPPNERPDLFTFSPCHGHYHFNGFASYALLDLSGNVVLTGRKQAYCMEDTAQVAEGPGVACDKAYDCFNQGIQAGWSDLYGNTLDCQWLDITGVAPGAYKLQVTLNPEHSFEEVTFDNNTATVPVIISAP